MTSIPSTISVGVVLCFYPEAPLSNSTKPAVVAFRDTVLAVVARIPKGKLASYGQVAALAGFPQRPRQVGMVLSGLPEGTKLPWHRVVNTRGYVPSRGRWWGAFEQIGRLRDEGIDVDDLGNLDLEGHRWDGTAKASRRHKQEDPANPSE